jgi:hypothetical protein
MADTAAHLVDRVFPDAPVRKWVLTLLMDCNNRIDGESDFKRRRRDTAKPRVKAAQPPKPWGQAPMKEALKGRRKKKKPVSAFQGSFQYIPGSPGFRFAPPWALLFRAFSAQQLVSGACSSIVTGH